MKPILFTFLLAIFTSCVNLDDMFKPLEKININGIVADTDNHLLDSVKVRLYGSTIMYPHKYISGIYNKDGIFKIEFKPEAMWAYRLEFGKNGYIPQEYHVDATKNVQECYIIMERAVE